MSEKVLYFGYGANRNPRMISAITGKPITELVGKPATLEGYSLAVQRLDQVPDVIADSAPAPLSPRHMLEDWGDDFTSYVIYPDKEGKVFGTPGGTALRLRLVISARVMLGASTCA